MHARGLRLSLLATVLTMSAPGLVTRAHGQWTITMRAISNPLPIGQCTPIEIVVRGADGAPPLRPDGRQLDWQDFELDFTATLPNAFAWSNERHRFLCAVAPVASWATVVARYPGTHLQPGERVPGINAQHAIVVANQVSAVSPPPPEPEPYAESPSAAGTPSSWESGTVPVVASGGVPAHPDPYIQSASGAPQTQVTQATPQPMADAVPVSAPAPAPAAVPAEAQPAAKSGGGFFKKLGAHVRQKAGEVTAGVVDTTLGIGQGLVSRAALQATATAQTRIGGVGRSLTPAALRGGESSDNLATVMAAGGGELRMLRFLGGTDVLEPAARDMIGRLATALNATHGNFVIESHVDALPSPAASQQLSEHRAAAVKVALIRAGVEATRLRALGYGASEPKPEVPLNGGAPTSARIVVAREPPPTP